VVHRQGETSKEEALFNGSDIEADDVEALVDAAIDRMADLLK
jgi:hypothetical protein